MPLQDVLKQSEATMSKAVDHLQVELGKIRTGRASTALLDSVMVNYYGSPTPLAQVGSVAVQDARTIIIQPWEKNIIGEIEKAIQSAGLGLNPSSDGNVVRVPVPMLTEERRKDLVKQCKKLAEEARVAVRNIRRDSIETLKKVEKAEHLSEDERKKSEGDVQKQTDKYIARIDEALAGKEKEVMEV